MSEPKWIQARTGSEPEPLFLCSFHRVMPGWCLFIVLAGIALAPFFLTATARAGGDAVLQPLFNSYSFDASYRDTRTVMVYQDRGAAGETDRFVVAIDDTYTLYNQTETAGISFRFDDGIMLDSMFTMDPSLFLPAPWIDSRRHILPGVMSYFITDFRDEQTGLEFPQLRGDVGKQYASSEADTGLDVPVHPPHISPFRERSPFLQWHETMVDRLALSPEPPEEPILPERYANTDFALVDDGQGRYSLLDDSEFQYGGNIRVPLSVPWLRGKTGRSGILPDAIYLGTDVDYFSIAGGLQSGNADYRTLSSELNQLGSEWLDTPTGYIHFEWRLGK